MNSTLTEIATTLVHSQDADWKFSAPGVSKKILRYDEPTGEMTLLLKFDPDSTYPAHNHPAGEEIFILEGDLRVGRDELGAGDYLYTPPNGKHAVSSRNGCLLFIRLAKPIELLNKGL
jgi:quercetin dioxygenase-like cupin family protein